MNHLEKGNTYFAYIAITVTVCKQRDLQLVKFHHLNQYFH